MKKFKQISQIGLMATLIGVTAFAQAANGTVGTTSTGTMALSVTVPKIIVITNVTDPAAATFDGSTDVNLSGSLCVGSNAAGYSITATSANSVGGAFTLTDGTNNVNYNVAWSNAAGDTTGGSAFVISGTPINYGAGPVSNLGCVTNNASAIIIVPAANLQAAPASTYTDTLSLTVAPI